jgi:hypothetical protein
VVSPFGRWQNIVDLEREHGEGGEVLESQLI